jgi:hypothetical protein
MRDTYVTPEGFTLYKPLLLPDARTFDDVLELLAPWDHATMSPRNGALPPERPQPTRTVEGQSFGPFCSVDLSQLSMVAQHLAVACRPATVLALAGRTFTGSHSFRIIGHRSTRRALLLAEAEAILASYWLAYIDPATVPGVFA